MTYLVVVRQPNSVGRLRDSTKRINADSAGDAERQVAKLLKPGAQIIDVCRDSKELEHAGIVAQF